jgi:hypothetical protein
MEKALLVPLIIGRLPLLSLVERNRRTPENTSWRDLSTRKEKIIKQTTSLGNYVLRK